MLYLVFAGIAGAVIGGGYAYLKKTTYSAHLSFILSENSTPQLNLSSLSGLAALGSLGGGSEINEDKLLFLSSSRFLMGKTLLSEYSVNNKSGILINEFVDLFDVKGRIKNDPLLTDFTYFTHLDIDSLTWQENKVLDIILRTIDDRHLFSIESKKKTGIVTQSSGIVTIDFVSESEMISKLFVDRLFSNLSSYYIDRSVQKQSKTYNIIKHRADSLLIVLRTREDFGANYLDRNVNMTRISGRVTAERVKRDVEVLGLMYAEVLKNLEIAKFNLESQTPVIQLVDYPTYPLKAKKASVFKFAIIGGGLALILVVMYLLFAFYIHSNKISSS